MPHDRLNVDVHLYRNSRWDVPMYLWCLFRCTVYELLKESFGSHFLTFSLPSRSYMQCSRWSRKYCCLDICPGADREGIVLGLSQASELIVVHGSCKVCFVMCLRIGVQDLAFSWNTRQIRGAHVPGGPGVDASLSNFSILFIYFDSHALYLFFPQLDFPGQTLRLPCSVWGPWGFPLSYCSHYPKHSI